MLTSSIGLFTDLGCGLVTGLCEILLQVLKSPGVESPCRPAGCSLVSVQSNRSEELISLARLWDGNTAGVEVGLEAGLAPGSSSRVESIFSLQLSIIGSLSVLVSCSTSSGSKGRRGRCGQLSTVLAGNGEEFISLASLWNLNSVLIGPCLNFYAILDVCKRCV